MGMQTLAALQQIRGDMADKLEQEANDRLLRYSPEQLTVGDSIIFPNKAELLGACGLVAVQLQARTIRLEKALKSVWGTLHHEIDSMDDEVRTDLMELVDDAIKGRKGADENTTLC